MTTLASLLMTAVLAVPAPDAKDETPLPEPTGPAPRLMFVKADADGKVLFMVRRANLGAAAGGARSAISMSKVELKDVKDLAITTPDGKKIELADAQKKLVSGAYVVLPADGKAISPGYLRMFRGDVIVLTSPELINAVTGANNFGGGVRIQGNGAILPVVPQPAPAPAPK
jgi:hypothetical protein